MPKFSFAVPVLPGKHSVLEDSIQYTRDHMDEYTASRERAGITMERVSVMQTPMGEFVLPYVEGSQGFAETTKSFITGGEYDQWFLKMNQEVSGIDFSSPQVAQAPPPELVGDFVDPQVSERKAGICFVAPLLPGKTEEGRAFAKEAFNNRRDEHTAARRKIGITHESVFVNQTPMGDLVVVYLEGDDPVESNRKFAASQDAYDVWFKDECKKIFPPEIDFNEPVPPIQSLWSWEAATVRR